MRRMMNRKGMGSSAQNVLLALAFSAVTYLIVTIILAIGATLNTTLQNSAAVNSTALGVYANASSGFATWAGYLPTIALVIVAVGVISLLFFAFGGLFREGSM